MRVHRWGSLLLALLAVLVATSPVRATTLSGAILFSSDSTGAPAGGQIWNTLGAGEFIFNLYLSTTNDATGFNSGNDLSTSINTTLVPGTNTFFMFAAGTSDTGFAALNLFFNGNNFSPSSPGIAAVNQTNSAGTGVSAASAPTTFDLLPSSTAVTSPQSLTFLDGSTTVTLTSFNWTTDSSAVDLVGAFNNTPDGSRDFFGNFTLDVSGAVSAVPEPGSFVLLGSGLAGLALAGVIRKHIRPI